jgi:hypothetical protein
VTTTTVDVAELEAAVGEPVASHVVEPLDPDLRIHSVTGGVFRVSGETSSGREFRVVLKRVRHGHDEDPGALWVAGEDPSHRNYWKREWLAFDSGLLDGLPGELTAPQTLLTTQPATTECHIWMEEAPGRSGVALTDADFAAISHAVGTTQGAYAAGVVAMPRDEWLSREWLRGWVDACARLIPAVADDTVWRNDVLAPMRPLRAPVVALWEQREALFAILDTAPATVVHCDFWPTNLFVSGDRVTAIDWSQIGIGRVAQDLDQVTLDTVWMQVRPGGDLDLLERTALWSYQSGLRQVGLDVDAEQLRHWYAAAAALHYSWMLGGHASRAFDDADVERAEQRWDRSFADITADRARVLERSVALGEWALGSAS